MKKLGLKLISLLVTTCCMVSVAHADHSPTEAGVEEMVGVDALGEYIDSDDFIASRLELRMYSSDVVGDLIEIIDDRSWGVSARAKAIKCLALYTDTEAVGKMDALFRSMNKRSKLYPQVVVSFMEQRGEDVAGQVTPLLKDKKVNVRAAAVIALGRYGGNTGYEGLLEAKQTEQDTQVLERISHYTH